MKNLEELLDFRDQKILIVGDVMLDRYLKGKIKRISPEAPVPILEEVTLENRLGGAANVALNVAALGATPLLCGVTGFDKAGETFSEKMIYNNLNESLILKDLTRKTTVKTRILADSQHILRIDDEDKHYLSYDIETRLLEKIEKTLKEETFHAVILQDYNKGLLSEKVIEKVLYLCTSRNIPSIIDPKKENFFSYKGCTVFKPNKKEIEEALHLDPSETLKNLKRISNEIFSRLNHKMNVITLSEAGIFLDSGTENTISPSIKRNISDVSGAGDTVLSIIALGITKNIHIKDLGLIANIAGGQVCEAPGVIAVNPEQLKSELRSHFKDI